MNDLRGQAVAVLKTVRHEEVDMSAEGAQAAQRHRTGCCAIAVIVGDDQQFFCVAMASASKHAISRAFFRLSKGSRWAKDVSSCVCSVMPRAAKIFAMAGEQPLFSKCCRAASGISRGVICVIVCRSVSCQLARTIIFCINQTLVNILAQAVKLGSFGPAHRLPTSAMPYG